MRPVCRLLWTSLLLFGVVSQADETTVKSLAAFATTLSPRAKDFIGERWSDNSFSHGITIIADTKEPATSRAAALERLHADRKKLTADEMRQFLSEATRLAKDRSVDEANSL